MPPTSPVVMRGAHDRPSRLRPSLTSRSNASSTSGSESSGALFALLLTPASCPLLGVSSDAARGLNSSQPRGWGSSCRDPGSGSPYCRGRKRPASYSLNGPLTCYFTVGDEGFEPATSSVSGKRSPPELIARLALAQVRSYTIEKPLRRPLTETVADLRRWRAGQSCRSSCASGCPARRHR